MTNDIIPGLCDPKNHKEAAALIHQKQYLDYECYQLLKVIINNIDPDKAKYFMREGTELIQKREEANDQLLTVLSRRVSG